MARIIPRGMVIAVDIDGTLIEEGWWRKPPVITSIERNIERINLLAEDNTIIIYTARPVEMKEETTELLRKIGVRYNELRFGKIPADLYIDTRNIRPEEIEI